MPGHRSGVLAVLLEHIFSLLFIQKNSLQVLCDCSTIWAKYSEWWQSGNLLQKPTSHSNKKP